MVVLRDADEAERRDTPRRYFNVARPPEAMMIVHDVVSI